VLELSKGSELPAKLAGVDALIIDPLGSTNGVNGQANGHGLHGHVNGHTNGHAAHSSAESGLDLIARIRKERSDVPVVVISADANVESVVKAMRLGVVDYVTKPAEQKRLSESADRLLEACSFQGVALGVTTRLPTLDEIEKRAIDCALSITKGQVSQAARMLGIGRATLYRKLAEMGRTPAARAARAVTV
jgi:DNA-binding NtrC family response regulator